MLLGPGLVHKRQTLQLSTTGLILAIAEEGAPACRRSSASLCAGACQNLTCKRRSCLMTTASLFDCSRRKERPKSKEVHSSCCSPPSSFAASSSAGAPSAAAAGAAACCGISSGFRFLCDLLFGSGVSS
eukprot:9152204-Prorocentrum_lima.AAC.1